MVQDSMFSTSLFLEVQLVSASFTVLDIVIAAITIWATHTLSDLSPDNVGGDDPYLFLFDNYGVRASLRTSDNSYLHQSICT